MGTLHISKITTSIEEDFSCGNTAIDQMLKDSLYLTALRRCYAYKVIADKVTLGYYMIELKRFRLEIFDPPLEDYSVGHYEDMYAMHIEYIAIKRECQRNKIGSGVLKYIIATIQELSVACPFRLLTVSALYNLVHWYESFGFKVVHKYEDKQNPETVLMVRDMLTTEELAALEQFSEV